MSQNQKGAIPILLILAIIGIVGIMAVANLAPFKDQFLTSLYPKDNSFASISDPISGPVSPSPSPFKLGDTDGDNDVDIFDYNIVLTDFGKNILPGTPADFDKDGDVDIFDYNIILTYFGT